MNTTTATPPLDTYRCPLHPDARQGCPCGRSDVLHTDLAEPAAIALWECDKGHRNFGPPTIRVGNRHGARCGPGCKIIRRLTVGVVPSRLNEGTPTP